MTSTATERRADSAAAAGVHALIADRWSPRAFDPAHELGGDEVLALLEAARWAPSAANSQPWRFVVAHRGEHAHDVLADALAGPNQAWAPQASALILIATETSDDDGRPRPYAHYDAGQAAALLVLQAQALGLATHQMGGFDKGAARDGLDLPDRVDPLVVVAVGRHEPEAVLPDPFAAREVAPRARLPIADLLLTPPARIRTAA